MYWVLNMRHPFPNLEANTTCFLLTIAGTVECALRYTCSIRAELFKWDVCQGRPIARRPSVPVDSFQLVSQQGSCDYDGSDSSIVSFTCIYPSPDGDRLCHSFAESIRSVPPFPLALSHLRTLQVCSERTHAPTRHPLFKRHSPPSPPFVPFFSLIDGF